MKSAGKARNNGLYRHIRTSKEIIRNLLNDQLNNTKEKRVLEKRGVLMDLTILVVGLILGVGIPLRNKAIKKRRENMKEKGNEEK